MDGETAIQYLYTLPSDNAVEPTLTLPNSGLDDCCKDFKTMVLANDGVDNLQNDITSFINLCSPTASAAAYKLYKDGVLKATFTNNSYGVYYAFGFTQLGVQKYIAYKVEWYKVLQAFGDGIYQISLSITDAMLGNTEVYSDEYKLCEYRPDRAEQTIRLDWWTSGTIGDYNDYELRKNYSTLNWHNQLRLGGFFGYPTPELTTEYVRYWNGDNAWTKTELNEVFSIKTKRIPFYIYQILTKEVMFSDSCTITDYNSKNNASWIDFEIKFDSGVQKPNWKPLVSKLADIEMLCSPRYNNFKKHRP